MIQVSDLSKSYGKQALFDKVSFSINPGERLGLVGRNGHGETTLFRLLAGEELPDDGRIHYSGDYRVGYLSQHLAFSEHSVLEEASHGLPLLEGGWKETYRAEAIPSGLGFAKKDFERAPKSLSGGFQVRLHLAKLILSEPNLLLLDEPTNYLDIVSMRWLTSFLQNISGEVVLITHDHGFVDKVTTHTLGIHRGKIRKVQGNTAKYYAQLELEEEVYEQSRLNQEKKRQDSERFVEAFRAKASKAKAVQSRIKALERMETLEKLGEIKVLDFKFTHSPHPGKFLLKVKDLSFHYKNSSELLIDELSFDIGKNDRICVIGRNGKGKSTLLQLVARELHAVKGDIELSPNLKFAYFGQTNADRLNKELSIEEELLAVSDIPNRTQARSIAGLMMFEGDAALKKVKVLSGGEKSRVLLGKLLLTPANLLILDEPDNHLDMHSTDALMSAVENFPGAVIMVTHSEMLLSAIATRLIVFDRGRAQLFEGNYEDFLRRVGWQEEDDASSKQRTAESQVSKKELRRLRADIIQRRSAELGPLQEKVGRIEAEISKLEKQVAQETEQLIEAAKTGFGDEAAKLSRELNINKKKVEDLYQALSELMETLESRGLEYEQELSQFN